MALVADGYSFVTIVSVLCSFFSLLFSIFSKRNLRDSMDEDNGNGAAFVTDNATEVAALVAPSLPGETPQEPDGVTGDGIKLDEDGDGARPDTSSSDVEEQELKKSDAHRSENAVPAEEHAVAAEPVDTEYDSWGWVSAWSVAK